MDWTVIFTALAALLGGLNIFQFIFFRSTKKKYEAEGQTASAAAGEKVQSTMERRLESLESLYKKQSAELDSIRVDYMKLKHDKFESDSRIQQLEQENEMLKKKVDSLEREVQAYRTIMRDKRSPE